jgi:membrane protein
VAASRTDTGQSDRGQAASHPAGIPIKGWIDILGRVRHALARDHIWVAAAGLAFCTLVAAIPGMVVVLAGFGSLADPAAVRQHMAMTEGLLPAAASQFLADEVQATASLSRLHLGGAVVIALWSARIGASTFISVFNIAYREREARGFVRYQLAVSAVTLGLCLFGLLALFLIAIAPVAIENQAISSGWETAIRLGRWPALAVLTIAALACIYRLAPSRSAPKWRWVAPGAVAATLLWLAGSAAFSHYVRKFASTEDTFGTLGIMLLLLSWFYLAAFTILLGAELNAEIERQTARDTTEGPERPQGQRGASVADTIRTG